MTTAASLQLVALILFIVVGTRVLGPYLAGIYSTGVDAPEKRPFGDRFFCPVERWVYRVCGVDEKREQRWTTYALSMLAFSLVSVVVVYLFQRFQEWLPGNPNGLTNVKPPAQPQRCARVGPGAGVQHVGQLRHQHQLAELQR
jgi:K+-transporting ATPase ATPase A chain